jgi:hypothetical protein
MYGMFWWEILGIKIIIAAVVIGGAYAFVMGPKGPLAEGWRKQIRDLEVKIKLDSETEMIEDLRKVARLYIRIGKRWEADQAMRRALTIAKQQGGESNPLVISILKECAHLMESMNRRGEATTFRREIKRIKTGVEPKQHKRF